MKYIASIAALLAAGFISSGNAMAQKHEVMATIPFEFVVNGHSLRAGHYTFTADPTKPTVVKIEDREAKVHAVAIVLSGPSELKSTNTLEFNRYGGKYFLREIRADGASMNCYLTASKQEKWAAQAQQASVGNSQHVIVALK
jgi:hypothetical protein